MPSGIKVGSAYSTYELDISGLRQGVAEAKRLLADLQQTAQKTKTPALGGGAGGGAGQAARDLNKAKREADQAFNSFKRLENEYNRVRDSEIKAARAAGDHAKALRLVQTELGRTAQGTTRYNNLLAQQSQIQRQAQGRGSGGGLGQFAGQLGFALGAQQLLQFGASAIQAANSLEQTQATVRALSGSQERYNSVLAVARRGQQLYGGSLEENLRGLGSLVNLANRSGASLEQLDNVSRRLAVIDPVQGIEGANIALKEFLSGSGAEAATSLARRFELPKKAIAELAKEGVSAKERLAKLDQLLAEQGITQEVLTGRTKGTAYAYTLLATEIDNARVAVGKFLAEQGKGSAKGAADFFGAVAGDKTFFEGLKGGNVAATEAVGAMNPLISALGKYNTLVLDNTEKLLNFAGVETRSVDVTRLATAARDDWARGQKESTVATKGLTEATNETNQQIADGVIKTATMRKEQEALEAASRLAAQGLLGAGNQAVILAGMYGISIAAARELIGLQRQIGGRRTSSDPRDEFRRSSFTPSTQELSNLQEQKTLDAKALADARRAQVLATETPLQRVQRLQQELTAIGRQGKETAAYVNKQTELIQAQEVLNASQQRGAKANISNQQKQIDLTERTTDAILKQQKAVVSLGLSQINDERKRMEEGKRVKQAQRVLNSPNASAEQRRAAALVLREVPLLQQERALDIAGQARDAGGSIIGGKLYGGVSGASGGAIPAIPSTSPLGAIPAPLAAPVPMSIMPTININVAFFLDSEQIAGRIEASSSEGVDVRIRQAYEAVRSSGFGRRS